MEFVIFSIAMILIVLTLAVLAYLHLSRQMRETTAIAVELSKTSSASAERQALALSDSMQETVEQLISATVTAMQATTSESIKAMDLLTTRSVSGSQSLVTQMQETIRSQSALLATKDPISYNAIQGAPPLGDDPVTPYPVVDEYVDQQAAADRQRAMIAEQERAISLLERMGVKTDGITGSPLADSSAASV